MMPASKRPIAIGVDAGGSKTTAWLAAADRFSTSPSADASQSAEVSPLAVATTGCGNVRSAGFDSALQQVILAIEAVMQQVDRSLQDIDAPSICLAAAGAGRPEEREQLVAALNRRFPKARIHVTGDAEPVLAAASPHRFGVALIAGTGSLAWGRNRTGRVDRCGGWGYLFGDEGSGYSIGVDALRAAACDADGRGPKTVLLQRLCEHFQIDSPAGLVEAVYGPPLTRRSIARLSGLVFEAAGDDEVSRWIIDRAAQSLAVMVDTLAARLCLFGHEASKTEDSPGPVLALSGGLLVHQQGFADRVMSQLTCHFADVRTVPEPVAGAVRLACADGGSRGCRRG